MQTPTGTVQLGGLVRYYRNGWYYGYLDSIKGAMVKIRPPKQGSAVRLINVAAEDVRTI